MNPEHKKYILDNIGKKSANEIASHLGLKERKIKKFLDASKNNIRKSHVKSSIITERQTAFTSRHIPCIFIILLIAAIGLIVWKDNFTFCTYTLKYAPRSVKMYNNLAIEYIKKKDFVKAKDLLGKAIELEPNYTNAAENLRNLRSKIGDAS